jgi:hypothetical protein
MMALWDLAKQQGTTKKGEGRTNLEELKREYDYAYRLEGPTPTKREMVAGAYVEALEDRISQIARRAPNPDDLLTVTNYIFGGSDGTDEQWRAVRDAARKLMECATLEETE